jgi:PAS domain S-box-containing protein
MRKASKVEARLGGVNGKTGSQGTLARNRSRSLGAAAGTTSVLAVALGALQLRNNGAHAQFVLLAGGAVVILVVMLVLLQLELRRRAAILGSLAATRQRLAYAVESGRLGVCEWDVKARQVHCDASWFALIGREPRERTLTTADFAAAIPRADLGVLLAALRNVLRGKTQTYDVEHRMYTLRGDSIWVRSRGKVLKRAADGRVQRVLSVAADISERVALSEAQHNSRALMLSQQADILQCFHSGVLHWGNACMVLPQIVELAAKALSADRVDLWYYGEGENELVCAETYQASSESHASGMARDASRLPVDMRKPGFDGAATREEERPVANGGEFFVDELVAAARDAMYLPILRSGARIGVLEIARAGHASGWATEERLYGVMISNLIMLLLERDAHREAQETLEHYDYQLRLITDSVPALIAYVNAQETLAFHNRAYYTRFGQTEQAAIGRTVRDILGEPLYRRMRKHLRLALDGTEVSFQTTYRSNDGVRRTDLIRLVPHLSNVGDVLGFYALVIDVTDQRRSEKKLQQALNQAESAARGRDAFLATVSHELRTPLNAIIGFNSLMLEKECSSEERRRYLNFARDAGRALLTQVNDLLDMAKIEAGKIDLESIDFDLTLLIDSSINMVRTLAQSRGLLVGSEISANLPRWVRGDPARLRQIVFNLLSNAVKFTEQGSIVVSARPVGAQLLEIAVADSGVGIPHDKLKAIFEKFNQADISITRKFGGTGLGLAICRSLVRLMGGDITVESMLGRGSIFRFTMPLHAGAAAVGVAKPLRGSRTGVILVVEDQEANAVLAKALLEDMGHRVELAANGREALDRLLQQSFDVVLMDLEMPVLGGLEATRRIRAMAEPTRNIPVIAMSASAGASDVARCKAAGMDEHIAKPIAREALMRAFERWIPERRAKQRNAGDSLPGSPISKLVAMVGHSAAMEIAAAFEAALVKRLELFRAQHLDLPAIKTEVHNLVGISATLGFDELTDIARQVDQRFKQGRPVEELVPQLVAKCEAAEQVMRTLLGTPVAG